MHNDFESSAFIFYMIRNRKRRKPVSHGDSLEIETWIILGKYYIFFIGNKFEVLIFYKVISKYVNWKENLNTNANNFI